MELGTFGAIIRFALGLEEQAADFYSAVPQGELAALFGPLAERSRERIKRLERARRELVSEMILESITGLDGADYQVAPRFSRKTSRIESFAMQCLSDSRCLCLPTSIHQSSICPQPPESGHYALSQDSVGRHHLSTAQNGL